MPPKKGVTQISRIDNAVPLSIVRCGSPSRPPGEQRAKAAGDLDHGEQDANRRPSQPDPFQVNDVERALHAIGGGAQKDDRHRRHDCRDRHQRKAAHIVRQSREHVDSTQPHVPAGGATVAGGNGRLGGAQQGQGQRRAQAPPSAEEGHAPPRSQATPATNGAKVVPIRAKKLNRPRYSASPSANWAIKVCEPDQPNCSAAIDDLQQQQWPEPRQ